MGNVAEFIRIREQIESLAKEIPILLEKNTAAAQARLLLEEATGLLANLTSMVDNDVQVTAVGRLTRLLNTLQSKVTATEAKRTVKKSRRA